jgi:molybdopterin converting factor small subunit
VPVINVKVRTIGPLKSLLGSDEQEYVLPADSPIADLLRAIGETGGGEVTRHLLAVDDGRVPPLRVLVNGRDIGALEGQGTVLKDADDVLILTPMAGG